VPTDRVVASMGRIAEAEDGWINLVPKIVDRDPHPTSLRFFTLFGGGGSGVTMGTWIPVRREGNSPGGASVGITHVVGRRVFDGDPPTVQLPPSWNVEQDHPRRGFVVRAPLGAAHDRVVEWVLETVAALTLPDRIEGWRADVYLPLAPKD